MEKKEVGSGRKGSNLGGHTKGQNTGHGEFSGNNKDLETGFNSQCADKLVHGVVVVSSAIIVGPPGDPKSRTPFDPGGFGGRSYVTVKSVPDKGVTDGKDTGAVYVQGHRAEADIGALPSVLESEGGA